MFYLQVVVVVVLLVSCTMASLLSVLSTLRLLAVPHDIYYVHYGLASLMCNLYSSLLACGLLAGHTVQEVYKVASKNNAYTQF